MKIWIDAQRNIISTDDSWDGEALANNEKNLQSVDLKGKSYLAYIKGDNSRMFIEAVFTRVLITGKTYLLHYRCDSPTTARTMQMIVKKENDNLLLIEHDLIHAEPLLRKILFTEAENAAQERCSICGKVKFKGHWYDALTNRTVFGTVQSMPTRSVICIPCKADHPHILIKGM